MILIHGWPELGLIWHQQISHFAKAGWRCVAPDMHGYGASSVPDRISAYAVRELVGDMIELHDALGGAPAVWAGHDWGSAVAWAMASHHSERCRAVINLCVPYLARGLALPNLVPLVDRALYPVERYPVGQWDYWLYYRDHFGSASRAFEADVRGTMTMLFRTAPERRPGEPAFSAGIRTGGGWFGGRSSAPTMSRDEELLDQAHFDEFVAAFEATGFAGADAWYMNDAANIAYAAEAPDSGHLSLPALFLHAARDTVCDTVGSPLADPMREDCSDLTEITINAGHALMLERPAEVNAAIDRWLGTLGQV